MAETRAEVPAEARLRLLVEASSLLSDTLDLRAVARGVARSVVPVLADCVHVDLVESLFHPERGAMVDSAVLFRVATVDRDDDEAALRPDEWVAYPPGGPAADALRTGTARGESADAVGLSQLFVPLRARGRVLGVVGLAREPADRRTRRPTWPWPRRSRPGRRWRWTTSGCTTRRAPQPSPCSAPCCRAPSRG